MLLEVTVPLSCWENFRIQEASHLKNVLPALVLIGTTTDHAYFSFCRNLYLPRRTTINHVPRAIATTGEIPLTGFCS